MPFFKLEIFEHTYMQLLNMKRLKNRRAMEPLMESNTKGRIPAGEFAWTELGEPPSQARRKEGRTVGIFRISGWPNETEGILIGFV